MAKEKVFRQNEAPKIDQEATEMLELLTIVFPQALTPYKKEDSAITASSPVTQEVPAELEKEANVA